MSGSLAYCAYLERVQPDTLGELDQFVHQDVRFKDPFNDERGIEAMRAILADLYETIRDIKFTVRNKIGNDPEVMILWTLSGELRNKPWTLDGASHLTLDENGLLTSHIDYWDAASGFYEYFPIIGWPLRAIRRRLRYRPPT